MRTNWETAVIGNKVILVPYRKEHVAKYHQWMADPFLQEMTASEPLSLEEEYEMQASWKEDEKKCTFIVLDKSSIAPSFTTSDAPHPPPSTSTPIHLNAMAGDVNLFLNDPDDDKTIAEIEVMIAEASCRRKGLGKEAIVLMMLYGKEVLGIRRFYCKINVDNAASLSMFDRLGYVRVAYVEAFREVELEFLVDEGKEEWREKLLKLLAEEGISGSGGGGLRIVPFVEEEEK